MSTVATSTAPTAAKACAAGRRVAPIAAVLVAVAVAASGCASVVPNREAALPAVAVPTAWSATARTGEAATDLASWWRRFNDPLLTSLVNQALEANTDVRSAQAAQRQARALRDVAAAGLQPAVSASASAQRSKSGNAPGTNLYRAGFDASWEPDVFGGTRAAVAAADADAQASLATLANTRVSIAAEVAVAYMQLRGFQARLAIARASLARQEETLQLTRWRAQAGLTTSLDVEQSRTQAEQTRAQIPTLQASIAQTEHALAVLTAQAPGALRAQLETAAPVPAAADDLALAIPADTLRQRPDVHGAERNVLAAAARVSQARAARYPSFNLSGSIGLSALTLGTLTDSSSLVRSILGSIAAPIFDGGAIGANIDARDAAFEQARVAYQAAVLTALKDVEDALVALAGARERLTALREAADAAQNAALLADNQYAAGLIDFQTVLDTQRTLLSVQDGVATTEAELAADYVRLYKALGGGWQPTPDLATAGPPPQAERAAADADDAATLARAAR
jgi:NodT family efflux transporter outer membrane factor (OMF) lipoprotein